MSGNRAARPGQVAGWMSLRAAARCAYGAAPWAGHTLRFVASLVSQGAQIVAIRQSDPFVLV